MNLILPYFCILKYETHDIKKLLFKHQAVNYLIAQILEFSRSSIIISRLFWKNDFYKCLFVLLFIINLLMNYNFIGIDLGSKTSILSHLNKNLNNVLLNSIGDRETPVCISYSDQERLFGEKAVTSSKSKPLSTVLSPQRYLTDDKRQLEIEQSFNTAKFQNGNFHLQAQNLDIQISPQQILTGYLGYLQGLTKNIPFSSPPLYSISVPNHCGYKARKQISKCMSAVIPSTPSLVSEKMAIGLDYLINVSKQKQNVLFIDFGHSKITAYVLKFTEDSIVELMEASYSNLGVRCLDQQLFNHLSSVINFKINQKGKLKLKDIASKTRIILSANSEHIINQDFGDNDFEYRITREMFYNICAEPFNYIKNFLQMTRRDIVQQRIKIDKIQVFGGGSRIPIFQNILSQVFQLPIKRSINNEAISRGCALYAHHKEKISKLGKIQLKQFVRSKVNLYINHYRNAPVGRNLDSRKAQNFQSHVLCEVGTYAEDKKLSIRPFKDHSIEIWIISEDSDPIIEYYNINSIEKGVTKLDFDISVVNGYPQIRSVSSQTKNSDIPKQVLFAYDSVGQIDLLRTRQIQFQVKDSKIIQLQEKRNMIQSQIFRVKDKRPEVERYLETIKNMNLDQLEQILNQLTIIQ